MKTTCGIVKDLLPLYIDGVCSEESKALVQAHLSECEKCQKYHEAMRMTEQNAKEDTRDMKLENGLKNLKSRVNRRILKLGLAAAALLVCILAGKHMLFDAPLNFAWIVVPCVLVIAVLIALIGTWFPARRIARLYPVEVLYGR